VTAEHIEHFPSNGNMRRRLFPSPIIVLYQQSSKTNRQWSEHTENLLPIGATRHNCNREKQGNPWVKFQVFTDRRLARERSSGISDSELHVCWFKEQCKRGCQFKFSNSLQWPRFLHCECERYRIALPSSDSDNCIDHSRLRNVIRIVQIGKSQDRILLPIFQFGLIPVLSGEREKQGQSSLLQIAHSDVYTASLMCNKSESNGQLGNVWQIGCPIQFGTLCT
jgi:hypothetical protein